MVGARQSESQWRSSNRTHRDGSPRGLLKAFKRFGIGSSSPKSQNDDTFTRPRSDVRPQASNDQAGLQSLPPYLAHLAGPSRPQFVQSSPEFPKAQHYGKSNAVNRLHSPTSSPGSSQRPQNCHTLSSSGLPRPPNSLESAEHHPISLQPGPIRVTSSASLPYPWELVPQHRPQERPQSIQPSFSSSSALVPSVLAKNSNTSEPDRKVYHVNTATPPRKDNTAKLSSPASQQGQSPIASARFSRDVADLPALGQCWGIKQNGTRCTRKVRIPITAGPSPSKSPGNAVGKSKNRDNFARTARKSRASAADTSVLLSDCSDSGDNDATPVRSRRARSATPAATGEVEEVYCFQHVAEVNKTAGFYPCSATSSETTTVGAGQTSYIQFDDWFGTVDLSKHTQALLRRCMSQAPSDVDRNERGYIYVYELRDRSNATHMCLKVGRTINVFRRLGQWRSQCQSKDPLLRAFLPSTQYKQQGLLSGADSPDAPAVTNSHKWERLIHLELKDIGYRIDDHCQDCGSKHREIFMIPRTIDLSHEGFFTVLRVVEKWLRFTQCLSSGHDQDHSLTR